MESFYTSDYFNAYKLDNGVWALISRLDSPKSYPGGNSMVIDLGDKTIVFDTFGFPQAALDVIKFVKDFCTNSDVIVVNSHYHFDHVRGNQSIPSSIISSDITEN